jgi:hypothetical protein
MIRTTLFERLALGVQVALAAGALLTVAAVGAIQ